jgi:tripeptide aminopeptidase
MVNRARIHQNDISPSGKGTGEEMEKTELLKAIQTGRARLETAADGWTEARAVEPGTLGDWSARDILAHVIGWEKWLVEHLEPTARGEVPDFPESDLGDDDVELLNAQYTAAYRERSWQETLADFRRMRSTVLQFVEAIPEAALLDPESLPWAGGSALSPLVAACTFEHYQEHLNHIAKPDSKEEYMSWDIDEIADLCLAIQQVPAPTGAEHERAAFVAARMRAIGLAEVEIDEAPNVYGRLPGPDDRPGVLVSAHLDTVFPAGTDLTNRREDLHLYGPGIGDNSMGVAGLLTLAGRMAAAEQPPACNVWFVANAGEEGMGDLKGMRQAVERLGRRIKSCIVLEGTGSGPWSITHRGLGVRRYRIETQTRGGHSWGAFGEPSAIHQLVRVASLISRWEVPEKPRTTFNIGVIEGGTSVNSIAEHASMLLDLRSEDPEALQGLITRTEDLVAAANAIGDAQFRAVVVGDRPTGEIPVDHPLVMAARETLERLGVPAQEIQYRIGSTDANIPLSRGIPAITIYLTEGHDAHRSTEWLSLELLPRGMALAWQLLRWATITDVQGPAASAS